MNQVNWHECWKKIEEQVITSKYIQKVAGENWCEIVGLTR